MKLITAYSYIADGALILQWLLIGYLFYSVNAEISIFLFIAFAIGVACKVMLAKEEEKIDHEIIAQIKAKIEKENEQFEKSFDKDSEQ